MTDLTELYADMSAMPEQMSVMADDVRSLPFGIPRVIDQLHAWPDRVAAAREHLDACRDALDETREALDALVAANVVYPERCNEDVRRQLRASYLALDPAGRDASCTLRRCEREVQAAERALHLEQDRQRALHAEAELLAAALGWQGRSLAVER